GGSSPWLAPRVANDSSAFVYLFSEDGESGKNLYVFDLLDEDASGRQISNLLCPPSEACHAIVDVVLQP
ncbi:MAG TPA: hypothetical protein VLC09_14060, partial [Polyangiaceae bacterium]|nr:hypothetical protein [Polyangiaceae bacterium]